MMFRPFRWAKWWRLGILGLATGEMTSAGGCNFGGGNWSEIINQSKQGQQQHFAGPSLPSILQSIPLPTLIALAAILIFGMVVLVLVHLYIASVLRFVLFDAVATGRYRLREGWRRWRAHGREFFLFNLIYIFGFLLLTGLILAPFLALIGVTARHSGGNAIGGMLALVFIGLPLFLLLLAAYLIIYVFVKDFAVPMVALEGLGMVEALRRVGAMARANKGDYAIYIVMKVVLAIVAAIGLAIIQFVILLIIIIPVALIAAGFFVAAPGVFHNPIVLALLVTGAVLAIFVLLTAMAILGSPVTVFFQSFALHYFSARYLPLWNYMNPSAPPAPPTEVPPPLRMPEPEPPPTLA